MKIDINNSQNTDATKNFAYLSIPPLRNPQLKLPKINVLLMIQFNHVSEIFSQIHPDNFLVKRIIMKNNRTNKF